MDCVYAVVRLVKTQDGTTACMKKVDLTGLEPRARQAAMQVLLHVSEPWLITGRMQEIDLLYRLTHRMVISYHEAFVYEGHLMIGAHQPLLRARAAAVCRHAPVCVH